MKEISKAEEMVLLAIRRLADEAYGVSLRRQIRMDTGKDYTYGTLYGLLNWPRSITWSNPLTSGDWHRR